MADYSTYPATLYTASRGKVYIECVDEFIVEVSNSVAPSTEVVTVEDGELILDVNETSLSLKYPYEFNKEEAEVLASDVTVELLETEGNKYLVGEYETMPYSHFHVVSDDGNVYDILSNLTHLQTTDVISDNVLGIDSIDLQNSYIIQNIETKLTAPISEETFDQYISSGKLRPALELR